MIELNTDIWQDMSLDVICVTTNGTVLSNGENIMGGGIALEAAKRIHDLPKVYGKLITDYGLHLQHIAIYERFDLEALDLKKQIILAFPTKYEISKNASADLIITSFRELKTFSRTFPFYKIGLPRPGVGLGGLPWENGVKEILQFELEELGERIIFYDYAKQP